MAKKAKTVAAKVATTSRRTENVLAIKSTGKPRKAAAKTPSARSARRSTADVAKLNKAVVSGLEGGKSAATLAEQLGISRTFIYTLSNTG